MRNLAMKNILLLAAFMTSSSLLIAAPLGDLRLGGPAGNQAEVQFDDSVGDVGPFMAPDACNNIVGYQAAPPAGYGIVDGACLAPCTIPAALTAVTTAACPLGQSGQIITTTTTSYACPSSYGTPTFSTSASVDNQCVSGASPVMSRDFEYRYQFSAGYYNPYSTVVKLRNRGSTAVTATHVQLCNVINYGSSWDGIAKVTRANEEFIEMFYNRSLLETSMYMPHMAGDGSGQTIPSVNDCGSWFDIIDRTLLPGEALAIVQFSDMTRVGHINNLPGTAFDPTRPSFWRARLNNGKIIEIERPVNQDIRERFEGRRRAGSLGLDTLEHYENREIVFREY